MTPKWLTCLFLILSAAAIRLPAQQSAADRKFFENTEAQAERGDANAQCDLGGIYEFGLCGVTQDTSEAIKYFVKAAEQNCAQAQFELGTCYANGRGVVRDLEKAAKWYRKAAENNDVKAQYNLGCAYFEGDGIEKNLAEAVRWWLKAAEQNNARAEYNLGICYQDGHGVGVNLEDAVKWYRKAAESGDDRAEFNLGTCYASGLGVAHDGVAAVKWFRKAAEQNLAQAEFNLGISYANGRGVIKNEAEAVGWYRKAAEQNFADAQYNLGYCYKYGNGTAKDYVEAYKWWLLVAGQGDQHAKKSLLGVESLMTKEQIAEGQKLARNFKPREAPPTVGNNSIRSSIQTRPESSGTGFVITEDGYLITNQHVVKDATQVRLVIGAGLIAAKVVKVDAANDLALLKAEGRFASLPVASSRTVKLGGTVATVGFPNTGMQGFAPKLAKGEIASLSGAADDARYFQISVPVQPGNSGGALVDARGNVVGIVAAKLNAGAALETTGALPENVNYAVKSSFLLSFLESVPDVASKLKEPNVKEEKFEDVVKSAQDAAVLVLVY